MKKKENKRRDEKEPLHGYVGLHIDGVRGSVQVINSYFKGPNPVVVDDSENVRFQGVTAIATTDVKEKEDK